MVSANPEEVTFVYQGVEYDATEYSTKHPGGPEFIENMKKERKDFTEYFKYVFFKTQMSSFRTGRESPQVFPRCFKRTTIQKLN
jgi:cytochrome b involved in lipid metabolism